MYEYFYISYTSPLCKKKSRFLLVKRKTRGRGRGRGIRQKYGFSFQSDFVAKEKKKSYKPNAAI